MYKRQEIRNDTVLLDGRANPQPENVQYRYDAEFLRPLDDDTKKELGITAEELNYLAMGAGMPMTARVKEALSARGYIRPNPPRSPLTGGDELYPLNMSKTWTTANYGPVWIPRRGATLRLTLQNLPLYERCIVNYENNTLRVSGGKIYINGREAPTYTFKLNYYLSLIHI